jgi:hypothetical protein
VRCNQCTEKAVQKIYIFFVLRYKLKYRAWLLGFFGLLNDQLNIFKISDHLIAVTAVRSLLLISASSRFRLSRYRTGSLFGNTYVASCSCIEHEVPYRR